MSKFRHCCKDDGCYVDKYKAPIEDFDADLPRNCQYSDIDGMTECNRHYLTIEFKIEVSQLMEAHWEKYPYRRLDGQLLMLENLSKDLKNSTIWLVEGDSPKRECKRMRTCIDGIWSDWEYIDWQELKARHRLWHPQSVERYRERLFRDRLMKARRKETVALNDNNATLDTAQSSAKVARKYRASN